MLSAEIDSRSIVLLLDGLSIPLISLIPEVPVSPSLSFFSLFPISAARWLSLPSSAPRASTLSHSLSHSPSVLLALLSRICQLFFLVGRSPHRSLSLFFCNPISAASNPLPLPVFARHPLGENTHKPVNNPSSDLK